MDDEKTGRHVDRFSHSWNTPVVREDPPAYQRREAKQLSLPQVKPWVASAPMIASEEKTVYTGAPLATKTDRPWMGAPPSSSTSPAWTGLA